MEVADEPKGYRSKECELCTDDEDEVRVSVSPRRFNLPPANEKSTRMEIVNWNSFPIYFRACTSNMDAFVTRPNSGRISPNNKASVVVHFFNSTLPVRRHEEVVIVTSMKPFDQSETQGNVCQYCFQPMNGTAHDHHGKYPFASDEQQYIKERYHPPEFKIFSARQKEEEEDDQYNREKVHPPGYKIFSTRQKEEEDKYTRDKYHSPDYKISSTRQKEEEKDQYNGEKTHTPDYKINSTRQKEEDDQYIREKPQSGDDKSYLTRQKYQEEGRYISGVAQVKATPDIGERCDTPVPKEIFNGHQERAQCKGLSSELEEVCLHAWIHRPSNGGCGCGNCFDLNMPGRNGLKLKDIVHHEEKKAFKEETKPIFALTQKEEAKLVKEMKKLKEKRVDESKMREREAHILARIIRARNWPADTATDTDPSELSSNNNLVSRKRRIISEDSFNKKLEKAKFKRHQKQLEEESKSTTTTEATVPKDREKMAIAITEKSQPSRKQRKWTIVSVEEKCNEIIHLSWVNFFLLMSILVTLLAIFVFCCNANREDGMYHFPCFYNLFH